MGISTHILDTSRGKPAVGVDVALRRQGEDGDDDPEAAMVPRGVEGLTLGERP